MLKKRDAFLVETVKSLEMKQVILAIAFEIYFGLSSTGWKTTSNVSNARQNLAAKPFSFKTMLSIGAI